MVMRTITVSDKTYRRAELLAKLIQRDIDEILSMLLEVSLPLIPDIDPEESLTTMPDNRILALTQLQMVDEYDLRHSELLALQKDRDLTEAERIELDALTRVYEIGILVKAQAMAEAVRRGLMEPLQP